MIWKQGGLISGIFDVDVCGFFRESVETFV